MSVLEWSQEGVPLVLIHGFGNDAHIWDDFAPTVAPYYRTLAIDLRGHGDSDHDPERRYDYAAHVADLEAVTAALGIERMVLVGHSLGGRVSTLFAAAHPERLAGLVIVDAGPDLDVRGTSRIATDAERHASSTFASPAEYGVLLARAYPASAPEVIDRMARHGVRERPDGRFERKTDPAFHGARGALSAEDREALEAETSRSLWEALSKIGCPTLLVRGAASDVLSPDTADRMEEVLSNGTLTLVPAASHSVMTDNPEGFAQAVNAFVLGED
ncbi:MAG: alpha/beta hydrolase [Myxococcota bacterium]|nr:alpha/beta hydrolase [Myxococcota bacterium]